MLTPETVHYHRAVAVLEERQVALDSAFEKHPKRFKGRRPTTPKLPVAAWINPPDEANLANEMTEKEAA